MTAETRFERLRETRDPELFRAFVEEYQARVFRLVVSILGPYTDADAEDVTQEVFLRAWVKLGQFRGESALASWLYRIAWTQAVNRRKSARFRLPHLPLESRPSQTGAEVERGLEAAQERERVAKCIEELPDAYRMCITMVYWLGATVEEVAEALNAPTGTVKSYLSRGRDRLRRCLESRHGGER